MKKLTSIWQIDEVMVENIAELSNKKVKYKDKINNRFLYRNLTYQEKLNLLLKKYLDLLKLYSHRNDGVSLWEEKDIRTYVNDKLKLALKWLFYYYSIGNLIESNKCANRLFNVTANKQTAKAWFPIVNVPKNSFWFRSRKPEKERFSRRDLFHAPFEKREYIGTNRFSIPGYPCLYLSSTMQGAREETEKVNDLGFSTISCFQNTTDIDAYDFTFFPQRDNEDWQSLYKDIMTYPFKIAASIPTSIKNEGKEDGPFKEEYIIPQLLLHCVIRQSGKRKLALLYSSTKSITNRIHKDLFYKHVNLVFPAVSVKNDGYCDYLINKFVLTEPQVVPFTYLEDAGVEELETRMKQMEMKNLYYEIGI